MIDSTLKNAKILIVDDKEVNIDILTGLLDIQGYHNLASATDPRLVAGLYQSFQPDLILIDLMMPHLSGYEVMDQLKEVAPANVYLPILVLTADITTEAKQKALRHGANDFLSKPFDLIEVGLRIENLLFTRFLHQQSLNQNQILEVKVKERTAELAKSNVELIVAREKAESGDRLKTAFIRNISHEIRTPLNGILGIYQVLSDIGLTEQEKEEYFVHLQASSDRLIKTVSDYMDIALLVSGNMEVEKGEFSPGMLLKEIYQKSQAGFQKKNLEFTLQLPAQSGQIKILSDQKLLRKVLSHLVDNAMKFTPAGSASIGFNVTGNGLEFFVSDTGVGIREEAYETIFEQFMQENVSETRGHEGNGLGLTIAKKMAELLGGRVWFESVKGVGSTFYLYFPCNTSAGVEKH